MLTVRSLEKVTCSQRPAHMCVPGGLVSGMQSHFSLACQGECLCSSVWVNTHAMRTQLGVDPERPEYCLQTATVRALGAPLRSCGEIHCSNRQVGAGFIWSAWMVCALYYVSRRLLCFGKLRSFLCSAQLSSWRDGIVTRRHLVPALRCVLCLAGHHWGGVHCRAARTCVFVACAQARKQVVCMAGASVGGPLVLGKRQSGTRGHTLLCRHFSLASCRMWLYSSPIQASEFVQAGCCRLAFAGMLLEQVAF